MQYTIIQSQAGRVFDTQSFILYAVLARPPHTYFIRISMMQKITKLFGIQCKQKKKKSSSKKNRAAKDGEGEAEKFFYACRSLCRHPANALALSALRSFSLTLSFSLFIPPAMLGYVSETSGTRTDSTRDASVIPVFGLHP